MPDSGGGMGGDGGGDYARRGRGSGGFNRTRQRDQWERTMDVPKEEFDRRWEIAFGKEEEEEDEGE